MAPKTFQQAITRIVTDSEYRSAIEGNPNRLLEDFPLDSGELEVLMGVWEKSTGDDVVGHVTACCCCCCVEF
jgi:hypothetical protein